jgi:hypothetical protein
MKLLSCDTMREGVIVSGAFLVVGATLIFFAARLLPNVAYLPLVANVFGIVSLLLAPWSGPDRGKNWISAITRETLKKAIPGHFQLGPSQARQEAH